MKEEIKPYQPKDKGHQEKGTNTNTQNPGKHQKNDETKGDRDIKRDDKDTIL